jgi:branched-chain amino acid transport system ATP-binding protein
MLRIEDLDVFHGDAQALDSVSLEIEQGAIVAIVGANGAGKTSLIRTIAGMHKPARGRILYKGADIAGWPSHKVCNLGIGQVAEGRQVFPSLSVAENLTTGAMLPRARTSRERTLESVYAMFPVLAERRAQAAGTLSGGEQRMLSMARVLVDTPKVLIADELSLGLAPMIVEQTYASLARLRDAGTALVVIEQHVAHALKLCETVVVMDHGTVAWSGPTSEALEQVRAHLHMEVPQP